MEQSSEQNKTEAPTPFKLKRARERGVVARGVDLGFFSALAGLAVFAVIAGEHAIGALTETMRQIFAIAPAAAEDPRHALGAAGALFEPVFQIVLALGATIMAGVILLEIVQVRGLQFTAKPLKPDFNRLNPAQGLKRLFSLRMLKETAKNVIKLLAYALGAWFVLKFAFDTYAGSIDTAPLLSDAMQKTAFRLLFTFILIAFFVAVLDQIISRGEFLKQMRMSRSELVREHKEREGEPRLKQKRKQLHAEFASQSRSLEALAGSDMLIVNPQHYAVAIAYNASYMKAPRVTAKGRNTFALLLKRRAALQTIAIIENPKLARALHKACDPGDDVPSGCYREIAGLYLEFMRARKALP